MKIVEHIPTPSTYTLDEITNNEITAKVELSELDRSSWVCRVFEIADPEANGGTLIYVPSVSAKQLFKQGGK